MYEIQVRNNETGKIWWEYVFSGFMMKRMDSLFNDTSNTYTVLNISKIVFSFRMFKKCLANACEMCITGREN